MIKVRRLGSVTFTTPDIERQVDYYTYIMGLVVSARDAGRVILATPAGEEALVLECGDHAQCTSISLQVSPKDNLKDVAKELAGHGIAIECRSGVSPAVSDVVSFSDPKGTRIEIFTDFVHAADQNTQRGIMPLKFGHVAFVAPDVQKQVKFYTEVLGFRVSDWRGDVFAFLRSGPDHHTVNFLQGEAAMVDHIAFELRDWAEVQRACDTLAKGDIPLVLGPIRHIIGHNIATYHWNPDGVLIELFAELDQMNDEELGYFDPRPWHQDRPQRPKVWGPNTLTNYWGPGRLAEARRQRQQAGGADPKTQFRWR